MSSRHEDELISDIDVAFRKQGSALDRAMFAWTSASSFSVENAWQLVTCSICRHPPPTMPPRVSVSKSSARPSYFQTRRKLDVSLMENQLMKHFYCLWRSTTSLRQAFSAADQKQKCRHSAPSGRSSFGPFHQLCFFVQFSSSQGASVVNVNSVATLSVTIGDDNHELFHSEQASLLRCPVKYVLC